MLNVHFLGNVISIDEKSDLVGSMKNFPTQTGDEGGKLNNPISIRRSLITFGEDNFIPLLDGIRAIRGGGGLHPSSWKGCE